MENKNKPMTIKEEWFCDGADFDCKEPYIIVGDHDCRTSEKILIPETMAYYLRIHWCGSKQMHKTIEENAIRGMQNKIKEALGIK